MMNHLIVTIGLTALAVTLFLPSTVYSQININMTNNKTVHQVNPHINTDPFQKPENQSQITIIPFHRYNSSSSPFALHSFANTQTPKIESSVVRTPSIESNTNNPLAVNLNQGFNGLDEYCCTPPDVQVAVGPNHVAEFVNLEGEIWTKEGTSLSTFSLYTFFTIGNTHGIGDPKILYDSQSGRWFASILDFSTNTVVLAVSPSNDPTVTGWHIYNLTSFSNCPDQPILGISDDKIVISGNDFANNCAGSYTGAQYVILDKAQAVAGTTVNMQYSTADLTKNSIHPVQSLSSTSTLYMVSTDQSTLNRIQLFSITGSVPSAVVSITNLAISSIQQPPGGDQPGTSSVIETDDARVLDAKWYQNKLWLSFNDGCTPSGDVQVRACAHLTQIDTSSKTITQNMELGSSGYYYFYPAFSIDSLGNLVVIFGYSSSTSYPSLAVTKQANNDPVNTLEQLLVLANGTVADTSGRYGDYFGAASDPTVARVWIAGEYHTSSTWSTFIGSTSPVVILADPMSLSESLQTTHTQTCTPPVSGDWTVTQSCTLTSTSTAHANVIVQSGVILTIPNGLTLNIDFTHYHLLVKSGGGVLIKVGGAIN